MPRRFDIAFSFAGEQRAQVVRLDAALQQHFAVERRFYDQRHETELAGIDLDTKFYEVFRREAEIVVACLSADYARKNWTNAEGKAIKDLMLNQEDQRVVLLRFDMTPVVPIPETAHYIDFQLTPLEKIVAHIVERHRRVMADPPGPRGGRTIAPGRPRSPEFSTIGTLFKGREADMQRLRESLRRETAHATAIVAHQAVHGEGGVGKTRLALEFGLRHEADYAALLFAQADTPGALRANLGDLAGPRMLDLGLRADADAEVRLAEVVKWLHAHPGWLLILDGVDSEEAAGAVEGELARLRSGHVIITSRISAWSGSVEPLALDVLSEEASVEFLLEATQRKEHIGRTETPEDEAQARLLAREVEGLALALEQSAAYIRATGTTIAAYRKKWAEFDVKVRDWHEPRVMKYPRSVATTWETSFAQLSAGAMRLLRVCALLAPAPIPVEMLEAASEQFDSDFAELQKYSLARRDGDSVRVHRLIQEVVAWRLAQDGPALRALTELAGKAMRWVFPEESSQTNLASWPRLRRLMPHVPVLAERLVALGLPGAGRLLNNGAQYLDSQARLSEAEPLMRRALAIDEANYGKDHPRIAIELSNLAAVLQDTNRLSEAEPLMRRALAIDEARYGKEHPSVATDLNNLAQLLKATNRLRDAEPLVRRALAIDEASYGKDHPRVAIDLNNLAELLQDTNRLSDAEPLIVRAAQIFETNYGKEHPLVATALNNLARLLQATNRLSDAEPLFRRALAIQSASYGEEHPLVATDLNNLAALLQATGRLNEAEPLMRRVVQTFETSFGKEHPKVATALNNLAQLLKATSRLDQAEPLMRRALAIDEASYGSNHPDVARDLNNLARLLQDTNRVSEAEPLMRRALAIDRASYGKDHPSVARDLNNLALLLQVTNRVSEAEPLMRRQFEILLKFTLSHGHTHPHLETALNNYATLLSKMGKSEAEVVVVIDALLAQYGLSRG